MTDASTDAGITIILTFPKGLSEAEAEIIGQAMAQLVKLNPEAGASAWRFSINGSPVSAYELGVATAEVMQTIESIKTATKGAAKKHK